MDFLGGSHDGRVLDKTASFSFDMGSGSIIIFVLRKGGNSAIEDLTLGLSIVGRAAELKLPHCLGFGLFSSVSACASSASVNAFASSLSSDNAVVQLRASLGEAIMVDWKLTRASSTIYS